MTSQVRPSERERRIRPELILGARTDSEAKTGVGALVELVVIVALAVGLALIQAFVIKPYQIPSQSMEPTLDVNERVLVNRFLYHFKDPEIGNIVVFHPPLGAEQGRECGVARKPGQACPEPTRRSPTPISSSGSSPVPGTRSRSRTGILWSTVSPPPRTS